MVDGMLTSLLDIGSNIGIIGLKTAQTFERVSHSRGHDIRKVNLTKRLYVSGVGHGAAVCDKFLRCRIARKDKGDPAVAPAVPRLDAYTANVAEGSGGHLPAILGLRSMPDMVAILIPEQWHEKMATPGSEMHWLLLGEGARALDLMETPSGHLALKVDECGAATEDKGSRLFTIPANPHC
eukprot:5936424-Pyramimonas_sp.AAC.1